MLAAYGDASICWTMTAVAGVVLLLQAMILERQCAREQRRARSEKDRRLHITMRPWPMQALGDGRFEV